MSNPAQEESDRFFNYKPSATSHPEDKGQNYHSDAGRHSSDDTDSESRQAKARTIKSSRRDIHPDDEDLYSDNDDEIDTSLAADMATMATTKQSYTIPTTAHFANTGPKGVIADAQNYHRARRSTFRRTLTSLSDSLSFGHNPNKEKRQTLVKRSIREKDSLPTGDSSNSGSDVDLSLDTDDDFMAQWRQQRLAELQNQFSPSAAGIHLRPDSQSQSQSRGQSRSPSRAPTYGNLQQVNAAGYLAAIESSPRSTHVVVFLYDPRSEDSAEVEDELKMLAYKFNKVRFVKLHHEIAEMETVDIPALLIYRGGDVFVTMSGVERDGLESKLRGAGVLVR